MDIWKEISSEDQILNESRKNKTLVIFKHSERCSISRMAKRMFEQEWNGDVPVYLIHVIESRSVSNWIAEQFDVRHQSPQLLIIKDGKCTYHSSHDEIQASTVMLHV
ncbi:MAG: bacillithiol system redox-active protein YtxJ [Bacteroidota bacterium]|jgi:bacillithiol system protein YtxJ